MKPWLWLLLSGVVATITWFYVHRILNPWTDYIRPRESSQIAEMGDMYSPWLGTRELLLGHRNPYSPEVSHEIQKAFYGHPIYQDYGKPGRLINEQRFAYPVYVVFLLAPVAHAEFPEVRRGAAIVLGVLTAVSLLLWLDFLQWRLPKLVLLAVIIFVLSSPQITQGLRLQQLALLAAFLLAAAAWSVQRDRLIAAGVLLALSTIKPQMTLLPIIFFLVWSSGDWQRRWKLPAAFSITLAALAGGGELVLPGWIGYFRAGAEAYQHYFQTFTSLPRLWLGDVPGKALGLAIVLALLALAYGMRKEPANSRRFTLLFSATLIGTILAFPLITEFNQVLLILPTMMLLQEWEALPKISRYASAGIFAWPWITSCALLLLPGYAHSEQRVALLPAALAVLYPVFLPALLVSRRSQYKPELIGTGIHVA